MITNQAIAEKIQSYLQHTITINELVDWAEQCLVESEFESLNSRDIVAHLGVADVKSFGLQWEDCEQFLNQLGYKIIMKFQKVA